MPCSSCPRRHFLKNCSHLIASHCSLVRIDKQSKENLKVKGWSIRYKLFGRWKSCRNMLLLFEKATLCNTLQQPCNNSATTLQQRPTWKSTVKWNRKKGNFCEFLLNRKHGNPEFSLSLKILLKSIFINYQINKFRWMLSSHFLLLFYIYYWLF